MLLKISDLSEQLNYKHHIKTIDDYMKRFYILQGSIAAGNNSDVIKDELRNIINILSINNKLSSQETKELLNYLN